MLKPTHLTKTIKGGDVKRLLVVLDAKEYILGRVATEVAHYLQGKNKTNYSPNIDMGDYVVVTNASLVQVTGKKEEQKLYTNYSGYQSGLRIEKLSSLRARKPDDVIRRAVKGMLPDNKLRARHMTRLFIYAGTEYELSKEVLAVIEPKNDTTKKES